MTSAAEYNIFNQKNTMKNCLSYGKLLLWKLCPSYGTLVKLYNSVVNKIIVLLYYK